MLQVKFEHIGDHPYRKLEIITNDEGEWEAIVDEYSMKLVGYGSENLVTIHETPLSDGTSHLLLVHEQVNNYLRFADLKTKDPNADLPGLFLRCGVTYGKDAIHELEDLLHQLATEQIGWEDYSFRAKQIMASVGW